jgi:hypothetical protein
MLVGTFVTDSNGIESLIAEDTTGFYLAKDAEVMVDILDKNLSSVRVTSTGVNTPREENKDES